MKETELITNDDGSIFHLRLKPGDLSDKIIIVGDPGRVDLFISLFDNIRLRASNREFVTITGVYKGKEVSVISSGIGTDNIDILINELDALFNINLETGSLKEVRKGLTLVRLGTSGGLQPELEPGRVIISEKAIGFDSVMNFYKGIEDITDHDFESAFRKHMSWPARFPHPYIIEADPGLLDLFTKAGYEAGLTISTPGFYAPQGRTLFLSPHDPEINDKIMSFSYRGRRILNYEMESSAIYGLARLMNHRAITLCAAIGNRATGQFVNDYKAIIRDLAANVLELI